MPIIAYILIGVTVGLTIAWSLFHSSIDGLSAAFDKFLSFALPTLTITAILLVVALPIGFVIVRKVVGRASASLDAVVKQVAGAASASAAGDQAAAVRHAEAAALEGVAWYAPIAARRSLLNSCLALLIAAGGLSGTALLLKQTVLMAQQNERVREQTGLLRDQNAKIDIQTALLKDQNDKIDLQVGLLRDQNKKIDTQTLIGEATRRSNILVELYSIVNAFAINENFIGDLNASAWRASMSTDFPAWLRRDTRQVSDSFRARLVSFGRTATPYWAVMTPRVNGEIQTVFGSRPLSPERGQLLVAAYEAKVAIPPQIDFSNADISGAKLHGLNLPDANFASLWGSDVSLEQANLVRANLEAAMLPEVELKSARMNGANLQNAEMPGADFTGAILADANLRGAILPGARFGRVDLSRVQFRCTDLTGAILFNSTFNDEYIGVDEVNLDKSVIGRIVDRRNTYIDELGNRFRYNYRDVMKAKNLKVSDSYMLVYRGRDVILRLKSTVEKDPTPPLIQNPFASKPEPEQDPEIQLAVPSGVITDEPDDGLEACAATAVSRTERPSP